MTPVIHCSAGNISFFPRTTFIQRNEIPCTKHNVAGNYTRLMSSSQRFSLAQSSLRLFHSYRSSFLSRDGSRIRSVAAAGEADVKVEEASPSVVAGSGENPDTDFKTIEAPSVTNSVETSESTLQTSSAVKSPPRSRRSRGVRRSDMPPVKNEDLIPGASFTGKVRSIQPFGAFIDFGAFTDGLVHVSRMSDGYVKDVGSLVSVGQEVKVRIVEANMETGRISLTMRDNDDVSRAPPQRRENTTGSSGSSDRPRSAARKNAPRRDEVQKSSKFVEGQVLSGTVKNIIRAGSFVSLPDGEEGFIPVDEETGGFDNIGGNSSLQVGQEVTARVLRFSRGKVTLTMKKEEVDVNELNRQLNKGGAPVATNPFMLAFRKNKDIAAFLDEREKVLKSSSENDTSLPMKTTSEQGEEDKVAGDTTTKSDTLVVESSSNELLSDTKEQVSSLAHDDDVGAIPETSSEDNGSSTTLAGSSSDSVLDTKDSIAAVETVEESLVSDESESVDGASITNVGKEADTTDTEAVDEIKEGETSESPIVDEVPAKDEVKEPEITSAIVSESETSSADSTGEISDQLLSSEVVAEEKDDSIQANGTPDEIKEDETSEAPIVDEVPAKDEVKEPEVTSSIVSESETSTGDSTEEISDRVLSSEVVAEEKDDSPLANGTPVIEEKVKTTKTTELVENIVAPANSKDDNPDEASATKATISPALVKQLRDETGAGMMDCKKALSETEGDIVKAQEFLRKKGLTSADKKASRATAEGRVGSYIHDSRIGVLIEVNCETDFVSRGEIFKQLVDDLAMQVAACPQVRYLVTEDVPEEFVNKEREIEMQKEDLLAKPEQIREKIVDGRIRKRLEEFALLEQPYIKNDKMVVKDWVKQTIATVGENIKVKRFVRYNLGEGLEKKSQDFAAEVAAQTAAKESPAVPKDQPVETKKETVEKPPTVVAVSAALVKQLREETGAGMMDCKKALTETGGDIEKAQEYLRKKGLSSADKKSTRLAAEGRISSYVHDTRIGCLIEVNSETDFVARNETFKELVDDLAMQVVACPQVEFVSVEDIPESIVSREKEIEMGRDDLKSKPENIREKIVEGRISKRLGELALLEQPFIKDDKIAIKDLVKQTVAALGENIRVRRFVRFTLGETTED